MIIFQSEFYDLIAIEFSKDKWLITCHPRFTEWKYLCNFATKLKNIKYPFQLFQKSIMPPKKTISSGRVQKRPAEEELDVLEEENKMTDENKVITV